MSPLPVSSSQEAKRAQVWSGLECAGGSPLADIPPQDRPSDARLEDRLEEGSTLELPLLRRSGAWGAIREQRVLRLEYASGDVRELRIRDVEEAVEAEGANRGRLVCESPLYDLGAVGGLVRRVEANGLVRHRFEVLKIAPSEHLNLILGGASPYSSGAPSHFSAGQVDPTKRVDVIYDWDTPLSALRELTKSIEGRAELQVRRDGSSGYLVDVRRQVGSSAPQILLSPARNLEMFRRVSSAKDQATRAIPQGGSVRGAGEGVKADMGGAAWQVDSVSGSTITFVADILIEDDQLVGKHAEKEDGTRTEVTGSTSPNQVTVADASGIGAGDLIRFRENAAGDQLTYLESPSAVSTYGVVPKKVQLSNVPAVDNVVLNPYLDAWTSGSPDDWNVVGGASVAENTNKLYVRKGSASAHVSGASPGEGIETASLAILPTEQRPYFAAQISLWVVSGSVRLELVDLTNGKTWYPAEAEKTAVTDELGVWVERLGVAPGEDFNAAGTSQVKVQVLAADPGTEFYLDAAQVSNTPGGQSTYYDGRASNRLWQKALDHLQVYAEPLSTYELEGGDLTALDDSIWPDEEVYVGQTARIRVPDLGIDFERRVKRIEREPFDPFDVSVVVESEEERLTRLRRRSDRRRREANDPRPEQTNRPEDPSGFIGFFDERVILTWDESKGASRYLIRRQGSGANPVERWENGTPWADVGGTLYVDADPQEGTLDLVMRPVNSAGRPSKGAAELSVGASGHAVEENVEETADEGTVEITPIWGDTDRTFTIRFWGRPANESWPGSPDAEYTGVPHGDTRSFTEPLPEKHGAHVRYDVIDEDIGVRLVRRVVDFDSNKVPDHSGHTLSLVGDEVFLHHSFDSDGQSLKYQREVGADPTRTEVQNGVTVPDRVGKTLIYSGLTAGETLHVGVLGYSEPSAQGLESEKVWRDEITRGTDSVVDIETSEDRAAGEGTADIEVIAKTGEYDVEVYHRQGSGSFPSSPADSWSGLTDGDVKTSTISLPEELNAYMRIVVYDSSGEKVEVYPSISFDRDQAAEFVSWSLVILDDGTPKVTGTVDTDGEAGKVHLNVAVGADPEAPDPLVNEASADVEIDLGAATRSFEHEFTGTTVPKGRLCSVKGRGESENGRVAPQRYIEEKVEKRGGVGSQVGVQPNVDVDHVGEDADHHQFDAEITAGADLENPDVEWRWKAEFSPIQSERSWSNWVSLSAVLTDGGDQTTVTETVEKPNKPSPAMFKVQAREKSIGQPYPKDSDVSPAPSVANDSSGRAASVIPTSNDPGEGQTDEPDGTVWMVY